MKPTQARVVVTGASGGIGRALAAQLHRRGAAVMLIGRDIEALRQAMKSIGASTERLACQAADVTTADGRYTALMPHAERVFRWEQMSWSGNRGGPSAWQRMFESARRQLGS